MENVTLNIEGMTCDMCVKHVTEALTHIVGVTAVKVSLENNKADVGFDPDKTTISDMIGAVTEEGYAASPR